MEAGGGRSAGQFALKPDLANYDAVIFDLFHTLIGLDGSTSLETAWEFLQIPEQTWRRALFSGAEDRLRGRISDPVDVIRNIVYKLDADIAGDKIEHASGLRLRQFETALSDIQPNILQTMSTLKARGKLLGVISNADKIEISSWPDTEISACIDSAVFSCEVGYIKPEKEIYLATLRNLGLAPGRCLFVGDGGDNELAGARDVGIDAAITFEFIGDRSSDHVINRRTQATYEIDRISDLVTTHDG